MVWLTNVPYTVFHTSLGSMCICSYTFNILILDQYFPQATSFLICSWSGKGVTSFSMFSFCLRPSMTMRSRPLFLSTHNIGAACKTFVSSHQLLLVYNCILSISCYFSESGQRGR